MDLDRFAAINEERGHAVGDQLLQLIAARIDHALRPSDTVARFGGDEFVIVCEDVGGPSEALEVADRLRAAVCEPVEIAGRPVAVTASVGVSISDIPGFGADRLLQAADRAMYEAKAGGRDATRLASPGAGWP